MTDPVRPVAPRERSIEQLRATLSMLCHYIWHRQTRPGEHMWSIPVNEERDFDCILSDAINELEQRRATAPVPCAASPADPWQPIETAPKDCTIIGALIRDGKVWRVHDMKHNGVAFYTTAGGSLPRMTHWMPLPSPPRAIGEGVRDEPAETSAIQPEGLSRLRQGVHAGNSAAAVRESGVQGATDTLSESSGAGRDTDAPVAVSLDPHRLTFDGFSKANRQRCEDHQGFNHALSSWSTSDWFVATVGELGEAANIVKKLNRYRDGVRGNKESEASLRAKLRGELADAFIYLDLIFQACGFDAGDAVIDTFNAKSVEIGYPARLRGEATVRQCVWTFTSDFDNDVWEAACGESWVFIDGGPSDNKARFCHGCGGQIVPVIPATVRVEE